MGNKSKIVLTAVISVLVTTVVTSKATSFLNANFSAFLPAKTETQNLENKLNTINYFLNSAYLYEYDKDKAMEQALKGYVEGLDEPYTHYFTKEEFSEYMGALSDGYVGIGVVISATENDEILVISTFEDSPAYNAGILPGDIIKEIDGISYTGTQMNNAVTYIKAGVEGTEVRLKILRNGEEQEVTVVRSGIVTKSVSGEMLDENIGLVHISAFNIAAEGREEDTYTEFRDEVKALQDKGMEKMIIDLRDNPGGEVTVVCNIADMLLGEGTITYIEYKNGEKETYSSDEESLNIPLAVLVNGNSASASEVLTGALKDYKAATIIGEKTFGKGVVQNVFPFADGSGISMTVANYYTPNGHCIHNIGIEPDIEISMPEEYRGFYAATVPYDEDAQLQEAIRILKEK